MTFGNQFFPCFIMLLALSSCHVTGLNYDRDDYLQEEVGYDFRAYPSHLVHRLRGVKFDNDSGKKQFRRFLADSGETVNVLNFGAKGDGSITMQIAGTIMASNDRSDYIKDSRHWLTFESVQNLVVTGGGTINGNGNIWWKNSCKTNKANPCTKAPTALTFYHCTNLAVQNLKIQNAQQMHVSFDKCTNVVASKLIVNSPENSPNTDGIHVTDTQHIQISSCTIGTGDDCISIVDGSKNVRATDITCGPGHGISIGSLGSGNSKEYVSDVVVNGAKLSSTTNGVRIKTWQGGSGSASNIKFQNIEMENVENPIIIDQNYCDQENPCQEQGSAVQVKHVVYQDIKGTSATNIAINLDCSKSHPCQEIYMSNVNLVAKNGESAKAFCKNVEIASSETLSSKFLSGLISPRCPNM
ncbi:pectin lyase-like superfamily protein [Striga asiatica]|uniref:Pectin lyase-like superfamily protein n=1 Tax=Striga asiatica TaxID=4170 RepID=A0A5A7NZH6_STRAF|nr:pectin lyase-like superfamily protein [Striga asiatica]